jgi:Pyridoxamine 5'-phosphate oxidase
MELLLPATPAVLATVRDDGSPHTVAVWFDWVEDRVLLNTVDRLAHRYIGHEYPIRDRPRVTAWLQPEHWFLWDARGRV